MRTLKIVGIFFTLGLAATFAMIFAIFRISGRLSDVIAIPFLWPWWSIVMGGTQILPSSVTLPYDPLGHPLLHIAGIIANSVYIGLLFYLVFLLFQRWQTYRS